LVTSKPGILFHVTSDGTITGNALDLRADTCDESEQGLLGVAVDPDFEDNDRIYLFYTFRKGANSCVNRVSRFELDGTAVVPGSERKLLNNMPATNGNHNGGDLQFGKDGHLYVSIGEAGVAANAQKRNLLSGKILRITADGKIPPGNPFTGRRTDRCHETGRTSAKRTCREIFALGLRNPFRIAHDPNAAGTRFFINDVGDQRWEEINRGTASANYGWPRREGPCQRGERKGKSCRQRPKELTNPIFSYRHDAGIDCRSITGGAFVPDTAGWSAAYDGKYLFADFACGRIFQLDPTNNGFSRTPFVTGAGPVIHLAFSPDGDLYYTTFTEDGQVRRVAFNP
ncbi:MAG: PQQ-dependent sugar dehydrogenase, partial [Chloroflexota bacterium]|nr:PQQ-dependent sugar dehydrogenase [Chloroflexota bacterium]